jgi:hypothetical protein
VRKWMKRQSKDFYATGFDALVKRWDMCINVGGGCAEKYHMFYVLYQFVTCLLTLPRTWFLPLFWRFALFQIWRTKWDFINVFYIALFQVRIKFDRTVPSFLQWTEWPNDWRKIRELRLRGKPNTWRKKWR